jgi:hypothetical protein
LYETANFLNRPNEESMRRVEEIRRSLYGVFPLCENHLRTKQELYARQDLTSTEVGYFQTRAELVAKMSEVATQASIFKAKFMTLSDVTVTAEAAGVNATSVALSSSKRYKTRHAYTK